MILIFVAIISALLISYSHAKRRIRRGQPPLAYHRWMVNRTPPPQRNRFDDPYGYARYNGNNNGNPDAYPMRGWAPPPPAYTNQEAPPPVYQPPEGATKVNPDQAFVRQMPPGQASGAIPQMENGVAEPQQVYR